VSESNPAQIEAEIAVTRERLAGTVDEIAERVKPANVARNAGDKAKAQVVDEDGNPRVGRIVIVAAVVGAYVALKIWRHRRK
jgi:hypothetical protein